MGTPLRLLIVEDSADDAELVLRQLRRAGYDLRFERVQAADEMKTALERQPWDLVVSDYSLPQFDGPGALKLLNESGRDIPFIAVSGTMGEDTAVAMMQAGARDFILKQNLSRLIPAVQRELQEAKHRLQQRLSEQAKEQLQIERDELLVRLKEENEDLIALTRITANAIGTLDLDEMLRVLLARVTEVMKADSATILLAEGSELRVAARAGVVDMKDSPPVRRVGEGFTGSIASRMESAYVEDASMEPLTAPLSRGHGIRSRLGVPIKHNGALIGVIHVGWLAQRPRRDREVHLLEVTAERCAAAVQNARLHHEVRKLSRVVEQAPLSIIITDLEGAIEYVNPTFCELTGYAKDEVEGRNPRLLKSGATPDETYREMWATINAGGVWRGELHNRKKNGETYVELAVIAPVTGSGGRTTHYVALKQDITARKQTEGALVASEQRLRDLIDFTPGIVWEADASTLVFTSVSKNAERLLGYPAAEWLSPGFWVSHIHPEDRNQTVESCHAGAERSEDYELEYRFIAQDGGLLWLRDIVRVVQENGKPRWLRGLIVDITAARQAQEALQSSLRDKDALLKEVHHRVKNNLQVINSLLRLETGRSADLSTKSVLKDMQGRIQAMALLHETLYRSGTFAAVDLGAYLRQLATQAFRTLTVRPGSVQLNLDVDSVQAEMDQAIPCGLLVNELISNSLKHGFPDDRTGAVHVELQALSGGGRLRLRVSDNGVGLAEDFESKRGQTLGLQLAGDLAKQLGGRLAIDPGLASGVGFEVTWAPMHV